MTRATYVYRKSNARLSGYSPRQAAVERAKDESARTPGVPWYVYGGPGDYHHGDFHSVRYVATRIRSVSGRGPVYVNGEYEGYAEALPAKELLQ